MRRIGLFSTLAFVAFAVCLYGQTKQLQLGMTPTPAEVRRWNITVLPDGTGLPPGSGTPIQGEKVYQDRCASCHGDNGQGNEPLGTRLVGGFGTLKSDNPILTVGSYWPYAPAVWDYIHRAMPYPQPGTLSANETYALTAFLLYKNGIIKHSVVMNKETLPKVQMPNRDGFVPDPRPDISCSKHPKDRVRSNVAWQSRMNAKITRSIRDSYDRVADEYARRFFNELQNEPLDRGLLCRSAGFITPSTKLVTLFSWQRIGRGVRESSSSPAEVDPA